jgi:hypothetical protein
MAMRPTFELPADSSCKSTCDSTLAARTWNLESRLSHFLSKTYRETHVTHLFSLNYPEHFFFPFAINKLSGAIFIFNISLCQRPIPDLDQYVGELQSLPSVTRYAHALRPGHPAFVRRATSATGFARHTNLFSRPPSNLFSSEFSRRAYSAGSSPRTCRLPPTVLIWVRRPFVWVRGRSGQPASPALSASVPTINIFVKQIM